MAITERVRRLRQQSLEAKETLSSERAELLTDFYLQDLGFVSVPVQRALAFAYLLEHKAISIGEGELIVGEKGPVPKLTPTYPELCCHSLEDLDIMNSRCKTSFRVEASVQDIYKGKIIPFWKNKALRGVIFDRMTEEWKAAYTAGVFTEFMEQRAPGHTVLDEKIYKLGMHDFIVEIDKCLNSLNRLYDENAYDKQEELKAMRICATALIRLGERYAEEAHRQVQVEHDIQRIAELEKIADVCSHVPSQAPRDFHEALQYYWFVHLGVTLELNPWDSFSPGHLDWHLAGFYDLTKHQREYYEELLQCFWIKFNNQPAPPKVGVTAAESGTYTDFAQINLGGVKADGTDGVNDVTYLLMDVIEEMRILQPSSSIQVSRQNPDRFILRAIEIIKTGFGQPSIFNADLVIKEMLRVGKSMVDACNGGTSGCVETGAFGKEAYILTGYFNIPKMLDLALHDGFDHYCRYQLGPHTGNPITFNTFEQLFTAFETQMRYFLDIKVQGNNLIEMLYARYMPAPFLSILIDDCILKGRDYHNGGPRYDSSYIQGVGLGTITDCLSAIDHHVFKEKDMTMIEIVEMLDADFVGYESKRQMLINRTPRYGNDNNDADYFAKRVFEAYYNAVEGRKNTRGGTYHINLLPTTCHIYFGSVTGATPDGRRAWTPLSEGISPVQGADRLGPTAVFKSASKIDQVRTGGTLLNMKLTPHLLSNKAGVDALLNLIRVYCELGGHHVQFNVVDAEILRKAKNNPENYRDLIVRVAGYSDYFCDLSEALQEEIIARTEQQYL